MESTIDRFRKALERMDSYGAPSDDSALMVDEDNCFYELLAGEEGSRITLKDLRQLVKELS